MAGRVTEHRVSLNKKPRKRLEILVRRRGREHFMVLRARIVLLSADGLEGLNGQTTPTQVDGLADMTAVALGVAHACALKSDGTVLCWGANVSGQLSSVTTEQYDIDGVAYDCSSSPVPVAGLSDATAIASGDYFTCALRQNGGVVCWGANDAGRLGNGTKNGSTTPVSVKSL